MAAEVGEDDEAWLYGGDGEKPKDGEEPLPPGVDNDEVTAEAEGEGVQEVDLTADTGEDATNGTGEDKEAGEVSGEEGDKEEEEEDEDSDDDVQVTIGDIKAQTSYDATPKFKSAYQRPLPHAKGGTAKGIDVDATGAINGVPIYDFDLNTIPTDEKPWNKPGADITDYFNYGFTEDTWMKYCEKQRRMRAEAGIPTVAKTYTHHNSSGTPKLDKADSTLSSLPQATPSPGTTPGSAAASAVSPGFNRRAGPPPGRKMSGTIDVIGGITSRRPQMRNEYPDFMPANDSMDSKKYPQGGLPPPGSLPPTHLPPPDFSSPPPGMPPTNIPPPHMGAPPPAYYPPPGLPPDTSAPPPGYNAGPQFGYNQYGAPPPGYGGPRPPGPGWDNRPPGGFQSGWGYGAMSPRSDSDFSSSDEDRDTRRFRGREMYDPFESSNRDTGNYSRRDRSRSKDRDRERRHRERDREERHRSRRKHDDDSHRSKHKKSKKSKRDREEESMETGGGGSQEEVPS